MNKSWIITTRGQRLDVPKGAWFDVCKAFVINGYINWAVEENCKIELGDTVYIYMTHPIKKIICKTCVEEINRGEEGYDHRFYSYNGYSENNDKCLKLRIIEFYLNERNEMLTYDLLKKHGLKGAIQGKIDLSNKNELLKYIESV